MSTHFYFETVVILYVVLRANLTVLDFQLISLQVKQIFSAEKN